jgi:ribonuclease HI
VAKVGRGIGVATNNVAEYKAAIAGLALAREHGAKEVLLRADSKLLIEQLSGRFRVKNPTLVRLHEEARRLLKGFARTSLEHVPRELNREADRLANQGVDEWLSGQGGGYVPPEPAPGLFD